MMQMQNNWKRKIILFLVSQSITLFGSQIVQMAIVWYVTLYTASGVWVAAFSVCSYMPQFVLSFLGGVWADRYNRKMLIIGADTGIAIATFTMFMIIPYISSEPVLLITLLFMSMIRSAGAGIQSPAVNAVIPQLVPKEHLMRYNGINATMQSVVQFSAPAAAGVVLAVGTLRATMMIDILTAVIGIALFASVSLPMQEKIRLNVPVLADVHAGISCACSQKLIGKLLVVYGLFTFLCVPGGYLSGLFVSRDYGNTYWYLTAVEMCGFGGMMAGGVLCSAWGIKSRNKTLLTGLCVFGAMAIGMGVSERFSLYCIFMVLYGVALTIVQTTIITWLQETTKSAMQGRVFGLMGSVYSLCYPGGMVIFGSMADVMPLQWIIVGSGIALIFISSCFFSHRFFVFTHTIFEVVGVNKKQKERQSRQKSLEKFNSITQKVKPENQNQTHNVRSEAVEPKNRQV